MFKDESADVVTSARYDSSGRMVDKGEYTSLGKTLMLQYEYSYKIIPNRHVSQSKDVLSTTKNPSADYYVSSKDVDNNNNNNQKSQQLYIPSIVTKLKKDEFIPQAQRSPFLHSSNENGNFKISIKDTKINQDNLNHDTPIAPRQSLLKDKKRLSKSLTRKSLKPISTTPINPMRSINSLNNTPEIFTFSEDGLTKSTTSNLNSNYLNSTLNSTAVLDTWNMTRTIRPHSTYDYKYDTAYFVPVTYECPRVRNNPNLVKMSQTAEFEREYKLRSYSKPWTTSSESYKYIADQEIHKIHYDKSRRMLSQSMPNLRTFQNSTNTRTSICTRSNNQEEEEKEENCKPSVSPVHVPENSRNSISHTVPRIEQNNVKHENKNGTVIGAWPIDKLAQSDIKCETEANTSQHPINPLLKHKKKLRMIKSQKDMKLTKLLGNRVYSMSTRSADGTMDRVTIDWDPETSGMKPRQIRKLDLEKKLYPYKNKGLLK